MLSYLYFLIQIKFKCFNTIYMYDIKLFIFHFKENY